MRTRATRVVLLPSLLTMMSGCATTSAAAKPNPVTSAGQDELARQQVDQARRISELEARIALLEADARDNRRAAGPLLRSGETVRIGVAHDTSIDSQPTAAPVLANDQAPAAASGRRLPSLRLYGHAAGGAREPLPPVPVVTETLPVAPLPEQRARNQSQSSSANDGITAAYRAALRALQERRFDEALRGFTALIADNPSAPLLPKALYWRGEALYAKREYSQALVEFEAVLERFPQSDKAPDALLKVALCFRHLGAEDKAQASFRRLRATYPNSQAATTAAREGST